MKRKVLEDFNYAYDGVHVNRLKAGRSYPIRDEHLARFEAEGKIALIVPAEETTETPAQIPYEGEPLALTEAERAELPALDVEPDNSPENHVFGTMKRGKGRGKK